MDLLGAAVQALQQIFTFQSMAHMLIGVSLGTIIGIIPGLGGNFCLAILIPFIFSMNPVAGIAFLEGAHAATATGSAVTSILINTPGASFSAATCLDGYPMTKKGEAGRALSAAAVASGVGGIIGAACLLLALPAVRPLVMAFSPPEFFALTLFGIAMIAFVGEGSFGKSLISGLLGLLISFIGNDPSTGINRFSFGTTYLFDGIDLIPVVIGLFAFSEMLTLIKERRGIVQAEIVARATAAGILQGILDNLRHWWLLLRCSVLGTFLGFIPGIGGEVAGFIAYGHAVQSSKNPEEFGQGRVEGVIAPESANNSKEGGALIPTLAFGIPGSSGMAILLGAFLILGLEPGPSMLKENLPMTLVIVWTLAFANLFAALICLGLANPLARIARLRPSIIVPVVLVVASLGAYAVDYNIASILVAVVFGFLGYEMRKFGYSRATLTIGLVLGGIAETNYNLSMTLYGVNFLTRPITLCLLVLVAVLVVWAMVREARKGRNHAAAA